MPTPKRTSKKATSKKLTTKKVTTKRLATKKIAKKATRKASAGTTEPATKAAAPSKTPNKTPSQKAAAGKAAEPSSQAATNTPAGGDPKQASTPGAYLRALPPEQRAIASGLRDAINRGLPSGYQERVQYGMLGWSVPHSVYPAGYHCDATQPVPFAGVGAQKRHVGLYLFCVYTDPTLQAWFVDAWKASGKKLDMGKSCVRIKSLDAVPLDVVTELVRRVPTDAFLSRYEASVPAGRRSKKRR